MLLVVFRSPVLLFFFLRELEGISWSFLAFPVIRDPALHLGTCIC